MLQRKDYFFTLFSEHLLISFLAVSLVTVVGISLGIWIFYRPKARKIVLPVINFLYTIPSIAMFGLLIPLVGIGLQNALLVLILYGLLPIVRNTYSGFNEVPKNLVEASQGLGSTPRQVFTKIYFPLALPTILSALRVTTVMVISLTGLAALIGAGGLGQAIFRGLNTMNTQLIVVGSLGISVFAILGDLFVGTFEKKQLLQRLITHNATKRQKYILGINISILVGLLLVAFFYLNPLKGNSSEQITVATKPTTEQYILGEIIAQTIENNTDLQVNRDFGIGGGTTNIHPAMLNGDFDIYVEYTGTAWLTVLKETLNPGDTIDFSQLQKAYSQKFKLEWLGLLGFNNTYTLALKKDEAQQKGIHTFSDLAEQSSAYRFGAEFDFFERPDAYEGLIKAYPFAFSKLQEMDINLRYKAISEGKVDVIDAFTTDAQLKALSLQVLEDDKHYFPAYEAGIVMREEVAEKYPQVVSLLKNLNGKLSTEQMRKLNYEVEVNKKSVKDVVREFVGELK